MTLPKELHSCGPDGSRDFAAEHLIAHVISKSQDELSVGSMLVPHTSAACVCLDLLIIPV